MTIEDLLGMSAAELKKLSDKELESYFAPYLVYVKPETGRVKSDGSKTLTKADTARRSNEFVLNANLEKARRLAASLGIKID